MTDAAVAATHAVPFVVTLVDTVHGEAALRDHIEARHQIALADRLLISKTDVRQASEELLTILEGLNPGASRLPTSEAGVIELFGKVVLGSLADRMGRLSSGPRHIGIDTFSVIRERPIAALALTMLLQAVAEHCGSRLLRLKGLIAVEELPGRPALIHGVRHVVGTPEFLDRWPTDDERTRMVFITRGMPRYFVTRLLDAIEDEVRDEIAASAAR